MEVFSQESNNEALSAEEYALRNERAARAREIRKALKLTREQIRQKYQLPTSTLQSWENVDYGGMNESGAQRLASIYQKEGVNVSPEYLMYGTGEHPLAGLEIGKYLINRISKDVKSAVTHQITEATSIKQELRMFYELHRKAVHIVIEDEGMSPWLMPGDYVGGKWLFDDEIKQAIGMPCIVQTEQGEKLVRILRAGNSNDCYTLVCANTKASVPNLILSEVKLEAVAPVIRIWKLKPSNEL